jgi:uncharacterized protein (DUF58 family)
MQANMPVSSSALSPTVVAAIEDLELSARLVVEGMRTGGNRSPFHGYSTEFRQHRPYRAGDDLKYLDWKLFARSDRLYTRQYRDTTNVPVMIVLDSSASMDFGEGVTKHRYASILAAALAYVGSDQGNAVGLIAMSGDGIRYLPARGGTQHLRTLIAAIDRLEPAGQWDPGRTIDRAAQLMRRKGIVIVISDLYDAEEQTARALRRLRSHGHDVSVLQVLAPDECELAVRGQVEFIDAETGERRLTDAASIAAQYGAAVRGFIARCRAETNRAGIDHSLITTNQAPERALRDYLQRRGGKRVAGHSHRPMGQRSR